MGVSAFTTKIDLVKSRDQLAKTKVDPLKNQEERSAPSDLTGLLWDARESAPPVKPANYPTDQFDFSFLPPAPIAINDENALPSESDLPNQTTTSREYSPRNSKNNNKLLGGPPSNIYPPPAKIGNLQVPAFTSKVNYAEVPLRRTESRDFPPTLHVE